MVEKNTSNKLFLLKLARLGAPIALQNFLSFSTTLANTIMVGKLGDTAISGVYMGNQIKTLLTVFLAGIEGAILVLSAQYHGKKDNESIRRILGIGAFFAAIVSLLLTIVCFFFSSSIVRLFTKNAQIIDTGSGYLRIICLSFVLFSLTQIMLASMRSVESTKVGFVVSLISLGVNIALNYILIFGKLGAKKFGIIGASIATVCASSVEFILVASYIIFIDKKLKIRIKNLFSIFKFEKNLIFEFIKYGSPIILGQLVWGANMLFATAVIGRQAKSAITAMSIAGSLANLAHVVTNGTSGALGILIGKGIGEEKYDEVRKNCKTAQIVFLLLGAATSLFILLIKNPFISIYEITPAAISEARRFINVLAVFTFGTCYQSAALTGILKSAKDTRFVFKVEAFSVFFAIFPLALIASRLTLAPWIIFAALKCDQFIKCLPAAIRVNKFKWLKHEKGGYAKGQF